MNWIFVGAGNMASSLIGGLIGSGASAENVAVVDPDDAQRKRATDRFGIRQSASLSQIVSEIAGDQLGIVIAVKPHIVETVCNDISANLASTELQNANTLIVSVAAGVRASSMQSWLPAGIPIVRCMPNTPALLGLGATALFANDDCEQTDREAAENLLSTAGKTLWVDQESDLDAVTALSGSGPAYFFYLIEHMAAAGQKLGLSESVAEELAIETAFGAASMARNGEHSPSVLRENVTSKGGTTAAALQVFNEKGLPVIVEQGMQAAQDRAAELGDQLAPD